MSTEGYKIRKNSPPFTIREFESHLKALGYKPKTAHVLRLAAGRFLRYCTLRSGKPCREKVEEFLSTLEGKVSNPYFNLVREGTVKYEAFLAGKEIPHMVAVRKAKENIYKGEFLHEALQEFLSEAKKNICAFTLRTKKKHLNEFLIFCDGELTSERIRSSLVGRTREFRDHVRQFLDFCFRKGFIQKDYAILIVSYVRPKKLPSVYSEEEISKAINYPSGRTPLRDKAILLLLATTGIRSGDIVSLKLSDIDAETQRISIVQQKTGVPLSLPLTDDVVKAVFSYVNHERPKIDSNLVFLKSVYPYGKMDTGSIRYLVSRNLRGAEIDISERRHGPHSFRASLASALIEGGKSPEMTRKILGHSDLSSLNSYVKLDRETLRQYALSPIKPRGRFALWLEEEGK